MDRTRSSSPSAARLAAELTEGADAGSLTLELEAWLTASPRFRAFATANAAKLRKKVRGAGDPEAMRDVRLELLVARLLTADRRLRLAWEPYGSGKAGPDFGLELPGERAVNLEVTRLHRPPALAEPGVPWLAKLRQLPPSVPNLIVVGVEGPQAAALDVAGAVRAVRARADARDEAYLAARGIAGSRIFFDRFLRLGAVITFAEPGTGDDRVASWPNGSARIAVPEPVMRACLGCLRVGDA